MWQHLVSRGNAAHGSGFAGDEHKPGASASSRLRFLFGDDLGRTGMLLFFASLVMLFAPLMIVFVLLRQRYGVWPVPGMQPPIAGFLVSTVALLGVSAALIRALAFIRRERIREMRNAILAALGLSIAFVICQLVNWRIMFEGRVTDETWAIAGFLYFFTGIHALHVIGGMVPLVFVTIRSRRGKYTALNHDGVRYCAMYWHFIDCVWLVMLIAFAIPGVNSVATS